MANFVNIENIMVNLDTVTMITPNIDKNYTNIYFTNGTSRVVKGTMEELRSKIYMNS